MFGFTLPATSHVISPLSFYAGGYCLMRRDTYSATMAITLPVALRLLMLEAMIHVNAFSRSVTVYYIICQLRGIEETPCLCYVGTSYASTMLSGRAMSWFHIVSRMVDGQWKGGVDSDIYIAWSLVSLLMSRESSLVEPRAQKYVITARHGDDGGWRVRSGDTLIATAISFCNRARC